MIKMKTLWIVFALFSWSGCEKAQNTQGETPVSKVSEVKSDLAAPEFSELIKQNPDAVILDVRSPREFEASHIANAVNMDINGNFQSQVSQLDPSKPVFVYCLSGARSSAAVQILRNSGFTKIFHLQGGLMEWRYANLPETADKAMAKKSMTMGKYHKMLESDQLVLVDFYADWCAPCKKMEPYLKEISESMKDRVKVVRVDADANAELCKELKIGAIPVLHLYQNHKLVWENTGFVTKETVLEKINFH